MAWSSVLLCLYGREAMVNTCFVQAFCFRMFYAESYRHILVEKVTPLIPNIEQQDKHNGQIHHADEDNNHHTGVHRHLHFLHPTAYSYLTRGCLCLQFIYQGGDNQIVGNNMNQHLEKTKDNKRLWRNPKPHVPSKNHQKNFSQRVAISLWN